MPIETIETHRDHTHLPGLYGESVVSMENGPTQHLNGYTPMIALETLEPVRRYLDLKTQIAALTDELESLKPEITAALLDEPKEQATVLGHTFTLCRRTTYQYSDAVGEAQARVKAMKKAEVKTGIATVKKRSCYFSVHNADKIPADLIRQ